MARRITRIRTMTLLQLSRLIEEAASRQPAINMIVRDNVLKLNDLPDCLYGAFVWTQGQHRCNINDNGASITKYTFTLFYIDRMNEDGSNATEVQSTGNDVLGNILRDLAEDLDVSEWTVNTFTQRFKDVCAGAYATITLTLPAGSCADHFCDVPLAGWSEANGGLRRDVTE